MKLVLQIALGVFIGAVSALFVVDAWRAHKEALDKAEVDKLFQQQEQARMEQGERIRALLIQGGKLRPGSGMAPPAGFSREDAQSGPPRHE
ncbi:MAG: hypothetical protein ABSB19_18880 [Methylomonas sp.]|jgi:hypothetical protein